MNWDCSKVAERVAPYMDDQLAPADRELFARHLEECDWCSDLVTMHESLDLAPLLPEGLTCGDGFWDRFDQVLAPELDAYEKDRRFLWLGAFGREWTLSTRAVLLYAAALLLTCAWGVYGHQRAEAKLVNQASPVGSVAASTSTLGVVAQEANRLSKRTWSRPSRANELGGDVQRARTTGTPVMQKVPDTRRGGSQEDAVQLIQHVPHRGNF